MQITEASSGAWHVVAVSGRADNTTADGLRVVLSRAVAGHEQVAVDCSAIDYISSAGIGALVDGAAAARRTGRRFMLLAPSPRVQQVLKICKLDTVLSIGPTLPPLSSS